MKPLPRSDSIYLNAAKSWLELGNCREANIESGSISLHSLRVAGGAGVAPGIWVLVAGAMTAPRH